MSSYAIFLRGVNVGGITMKMANLKAALKTLPLRGSKTLLASGNVVCQSEETAASLKEALEAKLRATFGYDAWVVVVTKEQLDKIIKACPYSDSDSTMHSYITLASSTEALDELEAAVNELHLTDYMRLSPESMAWLAPSGGTLDSPMSKLTARAKYKATTTTRNLRTLIKCRDALS